MKGYIIFGGTGSIGVQSLEIIQSSNDKLLAFTFNNNLDKALEIIEEFKPMVVGITNESFSQTIKDKYPYITVLSNILEIVEYDYGQYDKVFINAVNGSAGLIPTYEVINHGYDILLANKESLVISGEIIMSLAKEKNVKIIPIDSEHNGLAKILYGKDIRQVKKLIITASGGALRDYSLEELSNATANDALKHPNWLMGKDITINCATMMNKGYEVIEASYLFNLDLSKIDVIVHKESIIHALVEFNDGTIEANLGNADMRNPINFAINYPNFINQNLSTLDLIKIGQLNFNELDLKRYPCFSLALDAINKNGYYPTILNAANEAAVKLFLENKIRYFDIYNIVKAMLEKHNEFELTKEEFTIKNILKLDSFIKQYVLDTMKGDDK